MQLTSFFQSSLWIGILSIDNLRDYSIRFIPALILTGDKNPSFVVSSFANSRLVNSRSSTSNWARNAPLICYFCLWNSLSFFTSQSALRSLADGLSLKEPIFISSFFIISIVSHLNWLSVYFSNFGSTLKSN